MSTPTSLSLLRSQHSPGNHCCMPPAPQTREPLLYAASSTNQGTTAAHRQLHKLGNHCCTQLHKLGNHCCTQPAPQTREPTLLHTASSTNQGTNPSAHSQFHKLGNQPFCTQTAPQTREPTLLHTASSTNQGTNPVLHSQLHKLGNQIYCTQPAPQTRELLLHTASSTNQGTTAAHRQLHKLGNQPCCTQTAPQNFYWVSLQRLQDGNTPFPHMSSGQYATHAHCPHHFFTGFSSMKVTAILLQLVLYHQQRFVSSRAGGSGGGHPGLPVPNGPFSVDVQQH